MVVRTYKIAISELPSASVSNRVQVRNLSYENEYAHFHMKGFALGLVLKQRQKTTRKWPIALYKSAAYIKIISALNSLNFLDLGCIFVNIIFME